VYCKAPGKIYNNLPLWFILWDSLLIVHYKTSTLVKNAHEDKDGALVQYIQQNTHMMLTDLHQDTYLKNYHSGEFLKHSRYQCIIKDTAPLKRVQFSKEHRVLVL
jgi:hypothetical protein